MTEIEKKKLISRYREAEKAYKEAVRGQPRWFFPGFRLNKRV